MTTTTSQYLLSLAQAALIAAGTDAGANVLSPGDWATRSGQYPEILVRVASEDLESLGRGSPLFTALTTLTCIARVSAPAAVLDGGALAAETALWRLANQIMVAVINAPTIMPRLQQYPSVRSRLEFKSEGQVHLAELVMDIGMEWVADWLNEFDPVGTPIDEISVSDINLPGDPGFLATIQQP